MTSIDTADELNDNVKIQFRAKWEYDPPEAEEDIIPFGQDLATLREVAALIERRTGLKMRVAQSETIEVGSEDPLYEVMTDHCIGGPAPFEVTWGWLSGFENGCAEVSWKLRAELAKSDD